MSNKEGMHKRYYRGGEWNYHSASPHPVTKRLYSRQARRRVKRTMQRELDKPEE